MMVIASGSPWIGPFEAVRFIGTPLALLAFLLAVLLTAYRLRLTERRRLILSASQDQRAELVTSALRDFRVVDTANLTRDQRYRLATKLIGQRISTYKISAVTSITLSIVLGAIILGGTKTSAQATSLVVRLNVPLGSQEKGISGRLVIESSSGRHVSPVDGGYARFDHLPRSVFERPLTLIPQVAGFESQPLTVDAAPTGGTLSIDLTPLRTRVCGRVVAAADPSLPLEGIEVQIADGSTSSDETGRFCLRVDAPPGSVELVEAFQEGTLGYRSYETMSSLSNLLIHFEAP